jgi:hypothetical protein
MTIKNKMLIRFIILSLFLSLISCMLVGPDYKRPDIAIPSSYHQEAQQIKMRDLRLAIHVVAIALKHRKVNGLWSSSKF